MIFISTNAFRETICLCFLWLLHALYQEFHANFHNTTAGVVLPDKEAFVHFFNIGATDHFFCLSFLRSDVCVATDTS